MKLRFALLLACICALPGTRALAATTPPYLSYEGRILGSDGTATATAVMLRFSIWNDPDWTAEDAGTDGTINTGADGFSGWQETHAVTPGELGVISIQLGNSVALPDSLDWSLHRYLQVEIMNAGESESAYQLLDPTGDAGTDREDRKMIGASAYAKNAETVANRTAGSGSGDLVVLDSEGKISPGNMGGATNDPLFAINAEDLPGDAALLFGNQIASQMLSFSDLRQRFQFTSDVFVAGTIAGSGGIVVSGPAAFRSTLAINGVTYVFPAADGAAAGYALKTDGAGTLYWGEDVDTDADTTLDLSMLDARFLNASGDAFSGTLLAPSGITASSMILMDLRHCDSIDTDGDGRLHCGDDAYGTGGIGNDEGDLRYINTSGDMMSGALAVRSGLSASGTIASDSGFVINAKNAAQDAILTFGNSILARTLTFSATNQRFEFSAGLQVEGGIDATGGLAGSSLTLSELAGCDTIDTDETGTLICGDDAAGISSGSIASGSEPPGECGPDAAGALWLDTDTSTLYVCDVAGGRNKWLGTQDVALVGEQSRMCGGGENIGSDDDCAMSFGDGVAAGRRTEVGMYLPADITITGVGFSVDDDACRHGGSFDIEAWSTPAAQAAGGFVHAADVATGLTETSFDASELGVDLDGGRYVLFGIDNHCRLSINDWNLAVYYRWRNE